MGLEVFGGIVSGSLALLADAGHMWSDAGALALTLFAMKAARRRPTVERTYGYYRAEILAALANGATLGTISVYIFVEAYERFRDPPQVQGPLMLAVACGGLLVNGAGLWFLRGGRPNEARRCSAVRPTRPGRPLRHPAFLDTDRSGSIV